MNDAPYLGLPTGTAAQRLKWLRIRAGFVSIRELAVTLVALPCAVPLIKHLRRSTVHKDRHRPEDTTLLEAALTSYEAGNFKTVYERDLACRTFAEYFDCSPRWLIKRDGPAPE